jgi:hypothetical protein
MGGMYASSMYSALHCIPALGEYTPPADSTKERKAGIAIPSKRYQKVAPLPCHTAFSKRVGPALPLFF